MHTHKRTRATAALVAWIASGLAACDLSDGPGGDADGDGFTTRAGDCDDFDPLVAPGLDEVCDGLDNDCDGRVDGPFDFDLDGSTTCAGDCDDTDPGRHPAAAEVCDRVDQDCDGVADEDPGLDLDQDGVCVGEGDCDDDDPAVSPLLAETCDGRDDDCDGLVDEELSRDDDGDGHAACGPAADCDDADPTAWPGAPETCDGRDDDCDGEVDEGFDQDGDGATACGGDCHDGDPGIGPAAAEDCDGIDQDCDGRVDDAPDVDGDGAGPCEGDCAEGDPTIGPHAFDYPDGVDQDCDGAADAFPGPGTIRLDSVPLVRDGAPGWRLGGWMVAGALGAGGTAAVAVGAPGGDGVSAGAGRVEVVLASLGGSGAVSLEPWAWVLGESSGDGTGAALGAGDLDGDGAADDLAVGAPGAGTGSGRVTVVLGGLGPGGAPVEDAVVIDGGEAGAAFGAAIAAGDFDGDGRDDLAVGAPGAGRGAVYLFLGGWGGGWPGDSTGADAVIEAAPYEEEVGAAVASVPDLDGDGRDDLVIGSPRYGSGSGRAALFLGRGAASWALTTSVEDASTLVTASGSQDALGARVGGLEDVDGDGLGELWLGAPGAVSGSGRVELFPGRPGGFPATLADTGSEVSLVGSPGAGASSLRTAGDLDGDGEVDFAIGAPGRNGSAGGVYVLPGPLADLLGDVSLPGRGPYFEGVPGDGAGTSLGSVDLDGDGGPDLLIGAPGSDAGGPDSGTIYLLPG